MQTGMITIILVYCIMKSRKLNYKHKRRALGMLGTDDDILFPGLLMSWGGSISDICIANKGLSHSNFHSPKVVSRYRDPQL